MYLYGICDLVTMVCDHVTILVSYHISYILYHIYHIYIGHPAHLNVPGVTVSE